MAVTIVSKQHDTKITFKDTPTINGVVVPPADLAGCTLRFLMKTQDGSAPAVAQPATINVDGTFSTSPSRRRGHDRQISAGMGTGLSQRTDTHLSE